MMVTTATRTNVWVEARLKDLCEDITVGHVGPMATEYVDTGIPFLRSQNVQPFRIVMDDVKYISHQFHRQLKKSALHPGDVVVVRTGYPGTAAVIPVKLPISNCADLVIIRPSGQLDPHFLACLFNSTWGRSRVSGNLVGVAQQHFNIGAAREMLIRVPPIRTQRKIAAILSAYDDLIENNTRRIAILEQIAQALYREWFVAFRFPGHEHVRMVESAVGTIPEGWEVVRIEDIATVYRGRSYLGADIVAEGGLPFLNLKCIERDGGFRPDGLKRYQGPYKAEQTAKAGDIVMAVTDMTQERRIVARGARVPAIEEPHFVFSMDLVKIAPRSPVPRTYLYGVLRYTNFPDEVKQHANGVNVLHLNPARIEAFRFALAPAALRRKFAIAGEDMYSQCDVLQMKIANLQRTRDLLLPKLIAGEVDVGTLERFRGGPDDEQGKQMINL